MSYPITDVYGYLSTLYVYDNKIFVGFGLNKNSISVYDSSTGTRLYDGFSLAGSTGAAIAVLNEYAYVVRGGVGVAKFNYATQALINSTFINNWTATTVGVYNGKLYVGYLTGGGVTEHDPATGTMSRQYSIPGIMQQLAFQNDTLYVARAGGVSIATISTGAIISNNAFTTSTNIRGIAVQDNYIFLGDATTSVISVYRISTQQLLQSISGIGLPCGIGIIGKYLYECDTANFRIRRIDITAYVATVPLPPVITTVEIDYLGNAIINFTQATSENAATVTGYKYSINGGATFTTANTATSPIRFSGLPWNEFQMRIIATNQIGDSSGSNIVVASPYYPCFKEGTRILALNQETKEAEYIPVELLRKGDLVKTYARGFIPIHTIGHTVLKNPKNDTKKDNRLYRFTPDDCPELEDELCITGNHCILHQRISDKKRQQVEEHMGKIYITEGKYRVPAFLDDRAKPYEQSGPATIWHFALENSNRYDNYGVLANGLLVESSSIRYMTELSNMELV